MGLRPEHYRHRRRRSAYTVFAGGRQREQDPVRELRQCVDHSSPKLFAMIEDDRLFEKTAHIQGFDPTLTTFVRRYKPGSISGYPLAQ